MLYQPKIELARPQKIELIQRVFEDQGPRYLFYVCKNVGHQRLNEVLKSCKPGLMNLTGVAGRIGDIESSVGIEGFDTLGVRIRGAKNLLTNFTIANLELDLYSATADLSDYGEIDFNLGIARTSWKHREYVENLGFEFKIADVPEYVIPPYQ